MPKFSSFLSDRRGNIALMSGLLIAPLVMAAALSVDFAAVSLQKSQLQQAADSSALSAAKELYFANTDKSLIADIAKQYAEVNVNGDPSNLRVAVTFNDKGGQTRAVASTADTKAVITAVTVKLSQKTANTLLLGHFATNRAVIDATATAEIMAGGRLCVLTLGARGSETFKILGDSQMTAVNCAMYTNSSDPNALAVKDTSKLTAELNCSAGGFTGKASNFKPAPVTDCPTVSDPLASRPMPAVPKCKNKSEKIIVDNQVRTFAPGVHCGGIEIINRSIVTLLPGVHIFSKGKLKVDRDGTLRGHGVGLYFEGEGAKADFKNKSSISLSAPETGIMAGILIAADPGKYTRRAFKIESADARKLVGTIYLPSEKLKIGGDIDGDGTCDDEDEPADPSTGDPGCAATVGLLSEWTAIIVKKLEVNYAVRLVLNTAYEDSSIPVPEGVGPVGGNITLSR